MSSRRAEVVLEILRERGPLSVEQVGLELAARGGTRAKDPVASARDALRWHHGAVEVLDGRWMALIWALDGVVLPHRVLPQERERSCLRLDPDLSVLAGLIETGALRAPEGPLRLVADVIGDPALSVEELVPDRFLVVPYGMGRRLVPGSIVGVSIRGGTLDLVRLGEPEPMPDTDVRSLEGVAARLIDHPSQAHQQRPVSVEDLLLEVAVSAPHLLRELTEPVGDLLRRCGLATRRDLVGPPLSDWESLDDDAAVWQLVSRWEWQSPERRDDAGSGTWTWPEDLRIATDVD